MAVERTCDLLCIGGGLGGMAAAIRGADLGLDVLVVEKSQLLGGVAAYSSGSIWIAANHLAEAAGLDDTIEEADSYLTAISTPGISYDRRLRRSLLSNGRVALRYFCEEAGICFQVTGRGDHYYPVAEGSKAAGRALEVVTPGAGLGELASVTRTTPHFRTGLSHTEISAHGGDIQAFDTQRELVEARQAEDFRTHGSGLAAGFVKAALVDRAVPFELDAPAQELLMEGGVVTGAHVRVGGEEQVIRARRGVVLATGSYGAAPYAASTEGFPDLVEAGPPVIEGDGLRLADPTPAAIVRSGRAITGLGIDVPGLFHEGTDVPLCLQVSFRTTSLPHTIVVNADGRRFADESFYRHLDAELKRYDHLTESFPNFPCYLIMDDQVRQDYWITPSGQWPAGLERGDTPEALAERLGVDPRGLAETVERFNGFVGDGVDADFDRGHMPMGRLRGDSRISGNPTMGRLERAPFWGAPLRIIGTGVYTLGLPIDEHARVLTRDGAPVPGLYATGNIAAYTEVQGYTGGLANGRNFTYGYVAATHAAGANEAT